MKFSKTSSILFVGGAVIVSALAIGVSPALAGEQRSVRGDDLVPVLTASQEQSDSASADKMDKSMAGHVDRSSLRIIAIDEKATYSAGRDHSGREICLIVQTTSKEQASTAACIAVEKFVHSGLSAMASGSDPGTKVVAHLLPADVDTSSLASVAARTKSGSLHQVRPEGMKQLFIQHQEDDLPDVSRLPIRGGSNTFHLVRFPE